LDVSYNRLSGPIPVLLANRTGGGTAAVGTARFNASSFAGNKGLYGYPPPPLRTRGLSAVAGPKGSPGRPRTTLNFGSKFFRSPKRPNNSFSPTPKSLPHLVSSSRTQTQPYVPTVLPPWPWPHLPRGLRRPLLRASRRRHGRLGGHGAVLLAQLCLLLPGAWATARLRPPASAK